MRDHSKNQGAVAKELKEKARTTVPEKVLESVR
jgi:hypothetical protein